LIQTPLKVDQRCVEVAADDIHPAIWRFTKGIMSNNQREPFVAGFTPFAGDEPVEPPILTPGTLAALLEQRTGEPGTHMTNGSVDTSDSQKSSPKSRLGRAKKSLNQPTSSHSGPSLAGFQSVPTDEPFTAAYVPPVLESPPDTFPPDTFPHGYAESPSAPTSPMTPIIETSLHRASSAFELPAFDAPVDFDPVNLDVSAIPELGGPSRPTTSPALHEIRAALANGSLSPEAPSVAFATPDIDSALSGFETPPLNLELPAGLRSALRSPPWPTVDTTTEPATAPMSATEPTEPTGAPWAVPTEHSPRSPAISWGDLSQGREPAPAIGAPFDALGLTPPSNDVSVDELRAILTGAPDRFETVERATWDPDTVAGTNASPTPSWPSPISASPTASTDSTDGGGATDTPAAYSERLKQSEPFEPFTTATMSSASDGGFVAPSLDGSTRPGMIDPATDMTGFPGADKVKGFAKGKKEKEPKAPKAAKVKEPKPEEDGSKRRLFGKKKPSIPPGPASESLVPSAPTIGTPMSPLPGTAPSLSPFPASGVTEMPPSVIGFGFPPDEPIAESGKQSKEKKNRKSRLGSTFAKQDGPVPTLTDNLSDRSTKLLRIGAGALLALGLLLVAFLQFRGDPKTAIPSVPAITVENTSGSPSTAASGEPLQVPTIKPGGATSASTADDFFVEGEDFSFSEGEDFAVK
jgi:hypothetical protein